jgi:hypothetical protein
MRLKKIYYGDAKFEASCLSLKNEAKVGSTQNCAENLMKLSRFNYFPLKCLRNIVIHLVSRIFHSFPKL